MISPLLNPELRDGKRKRLISDTPCYCASPGEGLVTRGGGYVCIIFHKGTRANLKHATTGGSPRCRERGRKSIHE